MNIQPLSDKSELVTLCELGNLHLKPIAKMNIAVELPPIKDPGKIISNWDIMEKLKRMIKPHQFMSVKVSKSTIECLRFEAELENRDGLRKAIKALDGAGLKMMGFFETFKIRAAEAKSEFPNRHDWDSFFRDAKDMNEMQPGERPDTVYLGNLPRKWFVDIRHQFIQPSQNDEHRSMPTASTSGKIHCPSETILRRVFDKFGQVRCIDVPIADPYRHRMTVKSGFRQNNFGGFISTDQNGDVIRPTFKNDDVTFEAYVQFVEYGSFVRAMDALRGMKWVLLDKDGSATVASIKVDFDRTKHLSDKNIRRRQIERERLMEADRLLETERKRLEEEERQKLLEAQRLAEVERLLAEQKKLERRRLREEKRRLKEMELYQRNTMEAMDGKIRAEERKMLIAQRKLESVRLLTELFRRCQVLKEKQEMERRIFELEEAKRKEEMEKELLQRREEETRLRLMKKFEQNLRDKFTRSLRDAELKQQDYKNEKLCKLLDDSDTVLRSVAGKIRLAHQDRHSLSKKPRV